VSADGAITNIIVTWDDPAYYGHAYAEIWRSDTNNLASAIQVGMSPGAFFADPVGSGVTRYYWVRFVNTNDEAGAYNAVSGTAGTTGPAIAYIIGLLTGQISSTQLDATLTSRIDLIDANASVTNSVNARISATSSRIDTLQGQVSDLVSTPAYAAGTTYAANALVTYNGGIYRALQTTTGNLPTNTTYWEKIGDYTSLGQAVAANTSSITQLVTDLSSEVSARTALASQVNNSTTGLAATRATLTNDYYTKAAANDAISTAITNLSSSINIGNYATIATLTNSYYTRAATDSAISVAKSDLTSTFNNTLTGYTNTANLNTNYYTKAAADSAISTAVTNLVSTTALNTALNSYTNTATLNTNYYTKTAADDAISNATTNLVSSSTLAGYTTTAALQQNYYTKASGQSLEAQYTVKIDTNGYISGFGLASTANGATPTSAFIVRADSFSIASPTGPGVTPTTPFIVRTTPTTINGETVDAGVYIKDIYIQSGSITNAKIGNSTIENGKIVSMDVGKLTAGTLGVSEYIRSTNYVAGSQGFIIYGNGNTEFANTTVRGTVYANAGTFAGALSGATGTFTGALSGATGTFSGALNAASGTFTGALSGATGTFSGALSGASGTFTGSLTVGSSPAISGTGMTGSGALINSGTTGSFALGNNTTNVVYNGTALYLNGNIIATDNIKTNAVTSQGGSSASNTVNNNATYRSIYGTKAYGANSTYWGVKLLQGAYVTPGTGGSVNIVISISATSYSYPTGEGFEATDTPNFSLWRCYDSNPANDVLVGENLFIVTEILTSNAPVFYVVYGRDELEQTAFGRRSMICLACKR
jgi:hypothetical protein